MTLLGCPVEPFDKFLKRTFVAFANSTSINLTLRVMHAVDKGYLVPRRRSANSQSRETGKLPHDAGTGCFFPGLSPLRGNDPGIRGKHMTPSW